MVKIPVGEICEACGAALRRGSAPWHLVCATCGLHISKLSPAIGSATESIIDEDERESGLRDIRDRNFDVLLAWLLQQRPIQSGATRKPRLLDVGCAHGWFLEKAAPYFDTLGIEPERAVAERTARRGINVRQGFFPQALKDDEDFDVIVFNDVLEHIPRVSGALALCRQRLRPGGVILVNAPDQDGALYRLSRALACIGRAGAFERMWQKGLPSPHLYYFGSQSLDLLARGAGLRVAAARRLPAVRLRGLYDRIRCAGDVSMPKAVAITLAVSLMAPALAVLPSDITVWMLERE